MSPLLSVREAQERILEGFPPKPPVDCPLERAYGQVLAAPLLAAFDQPPFANSSMDGYAVLSADLAAASKSSPITLPVVQDIPAGATPQPHQPGTASRIMTGATLPDGADTVVPIEEVRVDENQVIFTYPAPPGQFVRARGLDIHAGDVALSAGKRLAPADVALAASFGYTHVSIYSMPGVALFSSGDELLTPGQPLSSGKIYDANQYLLRGLLEDAGAKPILLGIARDDPHDVRTHLDAARDAGADLILTSAGVSVGAYDYVRQVVESNGSLNFWKVDMRPGKPVAFGEYRGVPFLGLPGNPVSAYVGFLVFVLPILRKLSGLGPLRRHIVTAELLEEVESDGRESYLRCTLRNENGRHLVQLTGHQGSANLAALTRSNALLILPSGVKSLPAGAKASVWTLDGGDEI